ncbi:hypothetical protein VDGE_20427 [Verticillium dahliae]|uniref:Uncharacterized protein n=1 Tax=Verticillium dahliae TaxID=27337 RepID=A0A444RWK4_VERDA|nr:hypothetical protein VDGE_20427 [Verticillium dahliae]
MAMYLWLASHISCRFAFVKIASTMPNNKRSSKEAKQESDQDDHRERVDSIPIVQLGFSVREVMFQISQVRKARNLQYLIQPDAVSVRPDALQVPVSDKKVLVAVYGRPWAEETAQVS